MTIVERALELVVLDELAAPRVVPVGNDENCELIEERSRS